jgi:hypothetical protein
MEKDGLGETLRDQVRTDISAIEFDDLPICLVRKEYLSQTCNEKWEEQSTN